MILFWPVIATGLFDRDVTDAQAVKHPALYETGRLGLETWRRWGKTRFFGGKRFLGVFVCFKLLFFVFFKLFFLFFYFYFLSVSFR